MKDNYIANKSFSVCVLQDSVHALPCLQWSSQHTRLRVGAPVLCRHLQHQPLLLQQRQQQLSELRTPARIFRPGGEGGVRGGSVVSFATTVYIIVIILYQLTRSVS